jgi:hypothetical protein
MKSKGKVLREPAPKQVPAITGEGREDQLISYAIDLAEEQLRNGTASSQVITHYLKLGSMREKYERQKLEKEIQLLNAKTEAIKAEKDREILYAQAIEAMRRYSPHSVEEY